MRTALVVLALAIAVGVFSGRGVAAEENPIFKAIPVADWIEGSIVNITERPAEIVFMRSEMAEKFPVAEGVKIVGSNGRALPSLPTPSWCRILLDRGKVVQINVIRVKR